MPATKTPSMHHPRRRNVTTSMVGFKKKKKKKKKRRYTQKISSKVVNPICIAGNAEEDDEGTAAFEKAHMRSPPSRREERWLLPFSNSLLFQENNAVMCSTVVAQKVPQSSKHLCPAKNAHAIWLEYSAPRSVLSRNVRPSTKPDER